MIFTGVSSNSPCTAAGISRRAGRHAQRDIAKSAWMRMNLEAFTGLPASRPVIARCPLVQSTDERPLIVSSDETIRALKMTKAVSSPATPASNNGTHQAVNSSVVKRSIIRDGHKSSVSLEDQFWDALREIADSEHMTVSALVGTIDHGSNRRNLSSAIRVFVLDRFRRNSDQKLSIAPSDPVAPSVRNNPSQLR
jgi:predicted DNA-binding ribbon-helix-helix protein